MERLTVCRIVWRWLTPMATPMATPSAASPGDSRGLRPVRLKGLNRSGFQHKPSLVAAGMPDPEVELRTWRDESAGGDRPFPARPRPLLDSADYRSDLDRVVAGAEAAGVYLMLEFHG